MRQVYHWSLIMTMPIPLSVLPLTLVLLLYAGCTDRWEGFVYPDKNDHTPQHSFGPFASLQDCRAAARDMLAAFQALERGDYACGHNCDNGSRLGGSKSCQETLR
jgi:hypothetical protein